MMITPKNYFSLTKGIHETPAINVVFNGETLDAFSLKSLTKQEGVSSPLWINIILEVLVRAIRQENKIKASRRKREKENALFSDDMIFLHRKY